MKGDSGCGSGDYMPRLRPDYCGLTVYLRIWDSAAGAVAPSSGERANWTQAAVEVVRHYQEGKWSGYTGLIATVEIGNEPDSSNFWPSPYTKEDFFKLYSDTAKAIRAAFPTMKIDGPGITSSGFATTPGKQWTLAFLDYVKAAGAPLDFISGAMPALLSVPILSAVTPTQSLSGVQVYMGYGTSANEMVLASRYKSIVTFGTTSP